MLSSPSVKVFYCFIVYVIRLTLRYNINHKTTLFTYQSSHVLQRKVKPLRHIK